MPTPYRIGNHTGLSFRDYSTDRYRGDSAKPRNLPATHRSTLPKGTVVTLGGRLQWVDNKADDRFNPSAHARGQQSRTVHAYDVGASATCGSAFSFYGKFGRSFRIATVDENYNQFGGRLRSSCQNT